MAKTASSGISTYAMVHGRKEQGLPQDHSRAEVGL